MDDSSYNDSMSVVKDGCGVFNSCLNNLNCELHIPPYRFLGPGTDLKTRLARGDKGINPLDEAAKEHDIFYSKYKDTTHRHIADKILQKKAWKRVTSKDADLGERAVALLTAGAMKAKRTLGLGLGNSNMSTYGAVTKRTLNKRKKK